MIFSLILSALNISLSGNGYREIPMANPFLLSMCSGEEDKKWRVSQWRKWFSSPRKSCSGCISDTHWLINKDCVRIFPRKNKTWLSAKLLTSCKSPYILEISWKMSIMTGWAAGKTTYICTPHRAASVSFYIWVTSTYMCPEVQHCKTPDNTVKTALFRVKQQQQKKATATKNPANPNFIWCGYLSIC